jgi:hypothetical protein
MMALSSLAGLFLGRVALRLHQSAPWPVLLVPDNQPRDG